jgi:hypothetical protein
VLVLAAVEAEVGVELVLLAAVAVALFVEPSETTGAVTMPTGASVRLVAALVPEPDAALAGAEAVDVLAPALVEAAVLLLAAPPPLLLSRPTRVCNRLANSAARPPPRLSLLLLLSLPLEVPPLQLLATLDTEAGFPLVEP